MVHRVISGLLGTVTGLAGLFVSQYLPFEDLRHAEIPLWQPVSGIALLGTLMAAAFYMAIRFLRFAFLKKSSPSRTE
jgi:hypothetical protein